MQSIRIILQRNVRLRQFHKCVSHNQTNAASISEVPEKLTVPLPEGVDKPISPKIDKIVQEITSLNLLEVSELSDLLKRRLNLPDVQAMPVVKSTVPKQDEEEQKPVVIQSLFSVKMTKYDDKQKVALIKEIKNIVPGINLVQAKKFIESVPQVVKSDLSKKEAEDLKNILIKVGAEISIE